MQQVLVLWEVSRKQSYIYQSNRLKENKGASIIIEEVTKELPKKVDPTYTDKDKKYLIYNGGGSSLYRFPTLLEAQEFIKKISTYILKEYPGIEVFMVTQKYNQEEESIIEAIDHAYYKLAQKKNQRKYSGMQVSFGIEKRCASTGLPASAIDREDGVDRYISKEIQYKIQKAQQEKKIFDNLLPEGFKGILEFDELARGEKKYMAVIHIDGNRMGAMFSDLRKEFTYEKGNYKEINEQYIQALREFSYNIDQAYREAFAHMTSVIAQKKNQEMLKEYTYIDEGKFPLIPIILGGDDITFVCNGRIGLECARIFLEKLNSLDVAMYKDKKTETLHACAGVAIVRTSYPFSKAYQLAEDLCSNAKGRLRKDDPTGEANFSLIDWHIEQGDLMGSIQEIREKNYKTLDHKKLYMRPLYLNHPNQWNHYYNFLQAFRYITKLEIHEKKVARNKLKKLREVLKQGEKETQIFLESNQISNYFPPLQETIGDYCFYKDTCMYYDAIEMLDLFQELQEEKEIKREEVS